MSSGIEINGYVGSGDISVASVINDFKRREILPDNLSETQYGTLRRWLLCNSYIAELKTSDGWVLIGEIAYVNLLSDEDIAKHIYDSHQKKS